ncbi:hypothetical protein ACQ86N_03020 [Puia sp. P3]|uniref:hypothetical protein n=1 Tax=Puia sp. P3 TaxID=3423952 RepID=UPI003D6640C5
MGKFSVLGNHDYGDYIQWETPDAKQANLRQLKQVHTEIGFRLLQDEAITLQKMVSPLSFSGWRTGVRAASTNTAT